MSIANIAHLDPSTASLSAEVLSNVKEFIYCCRDGVESVVLVTKNKQTFQSVVGEIPEVVNAISTDQYYVDLASLGSEKVRMYVKSPNDGEGLIGWYLDSSNNAFEKKIYKGSKGLIIDRYDQNNNLISQNETESHCTKDQWVGNAELVSNLEPLLEPNNLSWLFLKKDSKPQFYIRVY